MKPFLAAFVFYLLTLAVRVYAQDSACVIALAREHRGEVEFSMHVRGTFAGLYRYRMTGAREASVTGMFMQKGFAGKKLSSAFVHAMLLRNPEIETVGALMVMDNLAASGLAFAREDITNVQCFEAIRKTPFYKTFSRFGFGLTDCKFKAGIGYLEIGMKR